jgi:hypothetical protein
MVSRQPCSLCGKYTQEPDRIGFTVFNVCAYHHSTFFQLQYDPHANAEITLDATQVQAWICLFADHCSFHNWNAVAPEEWS